MPFESLIAWINGKLPHRSGNEVIPIQISVEPRALNETYHAEMNAGNVVSDSSADNELPIDRRWLVTDNKISSINACGTSGNLGPFEREIGDTIEMSPIVSTPVVSIVEDRAAKLEHTIDGSLVHFQHHLSSSFAHTTVAMTRTKISRIVFAILAMRKLRRPHKPSSYIHTYMTMMYIFGTSAFRTTQRNDLQWSKKWLHWTVTKLQLVILKKYILYTKLSIV